MQKAIVVVGPTGVGKSDLSVKLAKLFDGEVISGDSMQVYKEMSIGTAKIKKSEMEMVPHHLVDCLSYKDEYNVKIFQKLAREVMQSCDQKKVVPIVCGGTGLYIKSLLYDYKFIEQEKDEEFASFLDALTNAQLFEILRQVDMGATENIHPNNIQRIKRAITMAHEGKKKSEIINEQEHIPLYDVYWVGLTMNREKLYERINHRVDIMMSQGLLEEVEELARNEDIWKLQCMQSIGYKEWKEYFNGEKSIEECVELIKKNSRNFAKRQYTWFCNQMPVKWFDIDEKNSYESIKNDISIWIKSGI